MFGLSHKIVPAVDLFGPDVDLCLQTNQKDLVLVDSTCRNLRRLALAVASQKPVLLEGPIGCGKTALVEFMAAVTGHTKATEILKVQLGDQTDSKVREHGLNLNLKGRCYGVALWEL